MQSFVLQIMWQESRAQEADALAAAMLIKPRVNSILLEETMELGLSDDQKTKCVLKFLSDLGFMHKSVSSHKLYVSYLSHILTNPIIESSVH